MHNDLSTFPQWSLLSKLGLCFCHRPWHHVLCSTQECLYTAPALHTQAAQWGSPQDHVSPGQMLQQEKCILLMLLSSISPSLKGTSLTRSTWLSLAAGADKERDKRRPSKNWMEPKRSSAILSLTASRWLERATLRCQQMRQVAGKSCDLCQYDKTGEDHLGCRWPCPQSLTQNHPLGPSSPSQRTVGRHEEKQLLCALPLSLCPRPKVEDRNSICSLSLLVGHLRVTRSVPTHKWPAQLLKVLYIFLIMLKESSLWWHAVHKNRVKIWFRGFTI